MGAFRKGMFIGFGVGYVMGSKAGRERYEQIRTRWNKVRATQGYQALMGKAEAIVDLGLQRGKIIVLDGIQKTSGKMKEKIVSGDTKAPETKQELGATTF